jgi:hypothetical protein
MVSTGVALHSMLCAAHGGLLLLLLLLLPLHGGRQLRRSCGCCRRLAATARPLQRLRLFAAMR